MKKEKKNVKMIDCPNEVEFDLHYFFRFVYALCARCTKRNNGYFKRLYRIISDARHQTSKTALNNVDQSNTVL